jgi:sugar phosphate permease
LRVENRVKERLVESSGAVICVVVVFIVSFAAGYAWAPARHWAFALGVIIGAFFAGVYMLVGVAAGTLMPRTLEGRSVGVHFMILLVVLPPVGAVSAEIARRYAMSRNQL